MYVQAFNIILGAKAFHQYKPHKQSIVHALFPQNTYTLVGFESGSSVPLADTVTTAPRRRGLGRFLTT
jgi:hypothetical protein